jgi:hypothetical protein
MGQATKETPMKPHARKAALIIAVVALIGSAACATSINRVLADPSHYRNREVKISGRVADSYSLADRGVYRIQDGSGALWVASNHGVPRNGARVSVRGTIREGFNLGALGTRFNLPPGIGSGVIMMEISHKVNR